jgi:hypothetical protein
VEQPRVAICVPSMNTWAANMAVCHSDLAVHSAVKGIGNYTFNIQCSVISSARNQLVRKALSIQPFPATHILWIDADMMFPADSLARLLSHDKDVVGAFYNKRVPPYNTVGHLIGEPDIAKGGLHRADIMPHGLVLVKREVYEDKLKAPWYFEGYDPNCVSESDPDGMVGEDVSFSRSCLANGIEMWCDADLTYHVAHIGEIAVPCLRPGSDPLVHYDVTKSEFRA